ncbi:MAG: tetratricopeptide repeat protein [Candidatus Latescibacteria bacterium]|nr:tetratricopeptide repeat protein [Candidatus Latescibacterota bacterium]
MRIAVLWLGIWLGACSAWAGVMEARQAAFLLKRQRPEAAEESLRRLLRADPQDALAHQILATSFLLRDQFDSAQAYYIHALQLDSTLAESCNGLGMAYTYGRQYQSAIRALAQAIELDAGQPAFYYNAGVAYERLERLDEARQAFAAALQLDPWNTEARRYLGFILLWQNRPAEALEQYVAACRLNPQESANWYGAGKAYLRLKQDSLAIGCLERARELGGGEAEVFYQLGLLYHKAGRAEAAERTLGRFRQMQQENPNPVKRVELKMTDPDPARNQYGLGELYARRDRPAAARARLYRAKQLGLTQKELRRPLLGELQEPEKIEGLAGLESMQHRDYHLALSHYRAAIRLEPRHALSYRHLGLALHLLQHPDEAIQAYQEAIRLDPQLAPAYNDLALVFSKQRNEHEKAVQLLQKAAEIAPQEKIYAYNLAQIHFTLGQYAEAAGGFERAAVLDPNSALTLFSLGRTQARRGRGAEAEGHLKRALEINPDYAEAYFELGAVYEHQGRLVQAAEMYERCIEKNPQYRHAHYALGQTYLKQGKSGEAREALRRFGELPDHRIPEYVFFAPPDAE